MLLYTKYLTTKKLKPMSLQKNIILLIIFLACSNLPVVLAQDSSGTTQETAQKTEEVKNIQIKGNKAISTNTILSKMKTKIGGPYKDNIINSDLKRLYLLGFFSDIKIDTQDTKEGLIIIITVEERPIIQSISFAGKGHLRTRDEKLKQLLKSKENQYIDYPTLSEDVRVIKKMYEKIGYNKAEVEYISSIDKENNKVKIVFEIQEGKRVKIKDILVEGNKSFPAAKILRLIKTKRAWLFNAGILKEEVLKEDIKRVKAFYRKNGFVDAAAEYNIKTDPKQPFLYITIKVVEGKKYLVGSVVIRGNKDITDKLILSKITEIVPDKIFSQDAVKKDLSNIQGLYFDQGYISAQVRDITVVDPLTGRVNVEYDIIENDITYVNKIKVKGNVKTKDLVIRRELKIKPGDRFDGDKLKRSKERLGNLGFFDSVSYDTEDTPDPNKKDLVVDVKETKTGSFSFGGGYSTVDQLVGFFEIEQKNFDWKNFPYFTGGGQNLRFKASFGSITDGFDLSFTEPWLFDYPVSFGFDGYKREHDRDTDVGYGYNEKVTGGDLRLGRELTEYTRADFVYRYENIDISDISTDATQALKDEAGKNNISSAMLNVTYDSRNNIFDTLRGNVLNGSYTIAGGPLAGDKDFWKATCRASHYFPCIRDSVLEIRARAGFVEVYDDSDSVPIYERFFAGGADSIRGYKERNIGPMDPDSGDPLGGNSLLIGNIEYTYPVFDFIKGAAFYDIGNVWSKASDITLDDLKAGMGLGIRLKTPIGPIRLDYGFPLNKTEGEDKKGNGRLHFSVSHGF
ncbi:MAG: outer membrane protein assembly factor BamA [Candidatus Omnitrophota bacterium]